jgi:hypothetical protein
VALGDEVQGTVRSCASRMSAGGGQSILNGISCHAEVVEESRDMVNDNDEVKDANDDPLGCHSVRSSSNRGLLTPSGRSIISLFRHWYERRGGLKLLSKPKTRISPFRALADKEE